MTPAPHRPAPHDGPQPVHLAGTERQPGAALTVLVAAPALWFIGWAIMRMRTTGGPGAWTTTHGLWIVAFAMFGVGCVGLARLAGSRSAPLLAVALTGAVLTAGRLVLDLVVGFAPTATAMNARYDAVLGVRLVCHPLAPIVFSLGLLALLVLAAVRRAAPVPLVVLAGCGILAAGVGHGLPGTLRLVEGAGALLVLGALAGIVRTRG